MEEYIHCFNRRLLSRAINMHAKNGARVIAIVRGGRKATFKGVEIGDAGTLNFAAITDYTPNNIMKKCEEFKLRAKKRDQEFADIKKGKTLKDVIGRKYYNLTLEINSHNIKPFSLRLEDLQDAVEKLGNDRIGLAYAISPYKTVEITREIKEGKDQGAILQRLWKELEESQVFNRYGDEIPQDIDVRCERLCLFIGALFPRDEVFKKILPYIATSLESAYGQRWPEFRNTFAKYNRPFQGYLISRALTYDSPSEEFYQVMRILSLSPDAARQLLKGIDGVRREEFKRDIFNAVLENNFFNMLRKYASRIQKTESQLKIVNNDSELYELDEEKIRISYIIKELKDRGIRISEKAFKENIDNNVYSIQEDFLEVQYDPLVQYRGGYSAEEASSFTKDLTVTFKYPLKSRLKDKKSGINEVDWLYLLDQQPELGISEEYLERKKSPLSSLLSKPIQEHIKVDNFEPLSIKLSPLKAPLKGYEKRFLPFDRTELQIVKSIIEQQRKELDLKTTLLDILDKIDEGGSSDKQGQYFVRLRDITLQIIEDAGLEEKYTEKIYLPLLETAKRGYSDETKEILLNSDAVRFLQAEEKYRKKIEYRMYLLYEGEKMLAAKETMKYLLGYISEKVKGKPAVIGLGSGSTSHYFIRYLGNALDRGKLSDIVCIPTSEDIRRLAKERGVPLGTLEEHPTVHIDIDGADEINEKTFYSIKGGGGALTQEKRIMKASEHFVVMVDSSKLTRNTCSKSSFYLEISEVASKDKVIKALKKIVPIEEVSYRLTEENRHILSIRILHKKLYEHIDNLPQIEEEINKIKGVVENGFFTRVPDAVIIGREDINKAVVIKPKEKPRPFKNLSGFVKRILGTNI